MSVAATQRFSRKHPCPICRGGDDTQRGKGRRCAGYLSSDGRFAFCTREDLAGALAARQTDPPSFCHLLEGVCECGQEHGQAPPKPAIVAAYGYTDAGGELLFQVVRYAPKTFKQRRPDGSGGWIWNLDGIERMLYRLPQLLVAVKQGEPIYLVEGEKDAEAIVAAGAVATCNPMGAGKWRDEYTQVLRGATITIVADRDDEGRLHAAKVAAALAVVAASVRIVEAAAGKDATDHLAAGHAVDAFVPISADSTEGRGSYGEAAIALATLLDELERFARRFVVMTDAQAVALALWIAHTYAIEAAGCTGYLHVTSPTKRCGKSRLLVDVLGLLVRDPLPAANLSEAALFRSLGQRPRTLLYDEVDAVFGPKARDREDLRALLNAGYRRGTPALRCVGEGSRQRVEAFDVFGAKALGGIGSLPDTLADRCIPIQLKRKTRAEHVERLLLNRPPVEAADLRERLAAWADQSADELAAAWPDLPSELDDRAQDTAEPLLAIADLASGEWPQRARAALIELRNGDRHDDTSELGIQVLAAVRVAFADADKMPTAALLEQLNSDEEAPWHGWRDGGLTARSLAGYLRAFGVRSRSIRLDDRTTPKGYHRDDFDDAWTRFLPETSPENATSATTAQPSQKPASLDPPHDPYVADRKHPENPHGYADVADVADQLALDGLEHISQPRHRGVADDPE